MTPPSYPLPLREGRFGDIHQLAVERFVNAMTDTRTDQLFTALKRGAVVLTANLRLARHLRSDYDRTMAASGLLSWPTPEVLPLSAWAASVWEEYGDKPVLGGAASLALWEKVITTDSGQAWPGGVARSAYEAYGLLKEYGIRLPEELYLTEEARALKRWAYAYDSELGTLGFIDLSEVSARVKVIIDKGAELPTEAVFAGFDEMSPATSAIISALKARGVDVWSWPGDGDEGAWAAARVRVRPFADETEEVVQAARWARKTLEPGMKIGFIVPELERYRELILREFSAELNPSSVIPGAVVREVFNISLGRPLADEPLVRTALDILSIGEGDIDMERLSQLLRSPYFAAGEATALARLDYMLKEDNRMALSIKELRDLFKRTGNTPFEKRADAWVRWLRGARTKELPADWARSFTDLLGKVGWLSGIKLTGKEFQAHKAWNSCLERFAGLGDILGRVTRTEAQSALQTIARETIHQPETPECNIQVLGLLESTGISFDRLWIMGCHDLSLPSSPSPNPFIPVWLQKERRLPRSSSERELEFAAAAVKRLLQSAPEVEVSYPRVTDERERSCSHFFSPFQVVEEKIAASARLLEGVRQGAMEEAPEDKQIPVAAEEKAEIKGGTSILKNQSMCPFRAFAINRLNATPVPATMLGLKPETRGTIIHAALKLFWEKVEDSAKLRELEGSGRLDTYLEELASKALEEASVPPPLSKRFIELEKRRLVSVLQGWIAIELSREVGFRVKALEAQKEIEIGGLKINGRVDRVDELEGGGEAIIDYKSGSPDRYDWLSRRPREPQILIYSSTGGFNAVSFARLVPGECRFVGISKDNALPGIKPYEDDKEFKKKAEESDWDGLMESWAGALESLAKDFMEGKAQADPDGGVTGSTSACRYCELKALCRITERGFHSGGEDEGGADE